MWHVLLERHLGSPIEDGLQESEGCHVMAVKLHNPVEHFFRLVVGLEVRMDLFRLTSNWIPDVSTTQNSPINT
ncbi:hypothetical protein QR680_004862 [Steinernema hermaphroditum]|uniref:Uncharacterized protein n=1 Tax=Steinernema hermaphroditum TaxID=289476 RepID=A0AA39HQ32_9BILA|nr:hypothetical protein QR680_004862 [Steinernema hermaphroditum]